MSRSPGWSTTRRSALGGDLVEDLDGKPVAASVRERAVSGVSGAPGNPARADHAAERAYARADAVEASSVGDRVVLYHRTTRTALVLNPTGSWLWGELGQRATRPELVRRLRARFPAVPPDDAARDVAAFLDELGRHGAIVATE